MRAFTTLDELAAAAGEEIGTSDWIEIDQDRVDLVRRRHRRPPVDPRRRRARRGRARSAAPSPTAT